MLKDKEHSLPTAGWNVVLLQLFCNRVLQDKYLFSVLMFIVYMFKVACEYCVQKMNDVQRL